MSISGAKSSLPFISLSNPNSVVYIFEINLRENSSTAKSVKQLADQWKQITILDSDGIESSVVNTKA